jgi:amino acid transporter
MESGALLGTEGAADGRAPDHGLKRNAIGYLSNVVIAVASTAPGYSLAATLGFIVAIQGVGLHAPAILLVSFLPMLFIAAAYKYMNRADPDCGTSFSWMTRAMGPGLGWLGGWAIIVADIVVMANLAQIAGIYSFLLFRWDSAAASVPAVTAVGVAWIVVMTLICYIGIELSARIQRWLLTAEILTLAAFAVVALVKVYVDSPPGSVHVSASWFSPFALGSWSALTGGVLLGVFIYWGWDSAVSVNEESENSGEGPGRAAVLSTILLVLIYVVVTVAAEAYAGTKPLVANQADVLSFLGGKVFPRPLDLLLIVAVLTSASASTQTTILPTTRTALSMARRGALPKVFGKVHDRHLTPSVATVVMGALSIVWFVVIVNISTNVLADSIAALGFLICFYYGLTGFACAIYYRRQLLDSVKTFLLVGVAPTVGGLMLMGVFVKALIDYSDPANTTSAKGVFGIGAPVVIGVGSLVLGAVLMLIARRVYPRFFGSRLETAAPGALDALPPAPSPAAT